MHFTGQAEGYNFCSKATKIKGWGIAKKAEGGKAEGGKAKGEKGRGERVKGYESI
jgi:hypothetical protein